MTGLLPYAHLLNVGLDGLPPDDKALLALHGNIKACFCGHLRFAFDPANPVGKLHAPTFATEEIMAAIDCCWARG